MESAVGCPFASKLKNLQVDQPATASSPAPASSSSSASSAASPQPAQSGAAAAAAAAAAVPAISPRASEILKIIPELATPVVRQHSKDESRVLEDQIAKLALKLEKFEEVLKQISNSLPQIADAEEKKRLHEEKRSVYNIIVLLLDNLKLLRQEKLLVMKRQRDATKYSDDNPDAADQYLDAKLGSNRLRRDRDSLSSPVPSSPSIHPVNIELEISQVDEKSDLKLIGETFNKLVEKNKEGRTPRLTKFTNVFYDRLFIKLPETRELFQKSIANQGKALAGTVSRMLNLIRNPDKFEKEISSLAAKHLVLGISLEMFEKFGETWCEALCDALEMNPDSAEWKNVCDVWAKTYKICSLAIVGKMYSFEEKDKNFYTALAVYVSDITATTEKCIQVINTKSVDFTSKFCRILFVSNSECKKYMSNEILQLKCVQGAAACFAKAINNPSGIKDMLIRLAEAHKGMGLKKQILQDYAVAMRITFKNSMGGEYTDRVDMNCHKLMSMLLHGMLFFGNNNKHAIGDRQCSVM